MIRHITAGVLFALLSIQNLSADDNRVLNTTIFEVADYKGKVVYLDFWASWCIPCRKSFPWMNQLRQNYSEQELVIIAVNLDKEPALAEAFLKEYPALFNVIYDPKGRLAKKFQIKGMPSSVIFDRQGKAVIAHTGFFTSKIEEYQIELQRIIDAK